MINFQIVNASLKCQVFNRCVRSFSPDLTEKDVVQHNLKPKAERLGVYYRHLHKLFSTIKLRNKLLAFKKFQFLYFALF